MTSRAAPIRLDITADLYPRQIPSNAQRFNPAALREYAVTALGPGFSIGHLATHLHLTPTFTSYLLRGHRQPSLATYATILAAAGLPLGAFMDGLSITPAPRSQLRG